MRFKPIIIFLACLVLGCRHCPRHTVEKPKIKQKLTSRLESGTKLYAEGFGPNQPRPNRSPSPAECVDLKAILEYSLEW